ncbi:CD1375 family protein [Clostridium sp. JS66]
MLKQYLIVAYAYLVKVGVWDLEPTEGSVKKVSTFCT